MSQEKLHNRNSERGSSQCMLDVYYVTLKSTYNTDKNNINDKFNKFFQTMKYFVIFLGILTQKENYVIYIF